MSECELRGYIDDLLAGRRTKAFVPTAFEAAQLGIAIELAAAREGADTPHPDFVAGLKTRLAREIAGEPIEPSKALSSTRRQVIVGTAAAATAAVASVSVDRLLLLPVGADRKDVAGSEMVPSDGSWRPVVDGAALAEGAVHAFDLGSVSGFVRRVNGRVEAVSAVCTHQGCKLWFDESSERLRCPCHATSFSPAGQVITHALPIAPKPLPHFEVRERGGVVEVLAPPSQPA